MAKIDDTKDGVQAPRKARKAIKIFHAMFSLLRYELGYRLDDDEIQDMIELYGKEAIENRDSYDFKRALYEDAVEVEETLRDLAVDKKIDHVRLIKRWEERQQLKEEREENGH